MLWGLPPTSRRCAAALRSKMERNGRDRLSRSPLSPSPPLPTYPRDRLAVTIAAHLCHEYEYSTNTSATIAQALHATLSDPSPSKSRCGAGANPMAPGQFLAQRRGKYSRWSRMHCTMSCGRRHRLGDVTGYPPSRSKAMCRAGVFHRLKSRHQPVGLSITLRNKRSVRPSFQTGFATKDRNTSLKDIEITSCLSATHRWFQQPSPFARRLCLDRWSVASSSSFRRSAWPRPT